VQHGPDGRRIGVQVERRAQSADDQRQHRPQRIAHGQHDLVALLVEAGHQPAGMHLAVGLDRQRAAELLLAGELDAGDHPGAEERQHRLHVVRRPVAQSHRHARAALAALAAQLAGLRP
jgi:hypothetical protein